MSVRYLVDSDWAVDYLNDIPEVRQRLQELIRRRIVAILMISLGELYEGTLYARDPKASERALRRFLRGIPRLGVDYEVARRFGSERGRLRSARQMIGDLDLLIAATALRHKLILLTN